MNTGEVLQEATAFGFSCHNETAKGAAAQGRFAAFQADPAWHGLDLMAGQTLGFEHRFDMALKMYAPLKGLGEFHFRKDIDSSRPCLALLGSMLTGDQTGKGQNGIEGVTQRTHDEAT